MGSLHNQEVLWPRLVGRREAYARLPTARSSQDSGVELGSEVLGLRLEGSGLRIQGLRFSVQSLHAFEAQKGPTQTM